MPAPKVWTHAASSVHYSMPRVSPRPGLSQKPPVCDKAAFERVVELISAPTEPKQAPMART